MTPITSYIDAIYYLNNEVAKLTYTQAMLLNQTIIEYFVSVLPDDWLAAELPNERPHYQMLRDVIEQGNWQVTTLQAVISNLDAIMVEMGNAYPHTTDLYPMSLLIMVDNFIEFSLNPDDYQEYTLGVVNEFMTAADAVASEEIGESVDLDFWLEYPVIDRAFGRISQWIEQLHNQ